MYKSMFTVAAAAAMATGALAQATSGSHNPALKNSAPHNAMTPAEGRNSFTEGQAQDRVAKAGYTGVSKLVKDQNGVWQGTAMKGGAKVNVGLDYKGNIVTH